MNRQPDVERGFTIIELLIATTVLSVVLLLVTVVITSIGNLYYKGVNQSRLQDTVRGLTDEVGQKLELNSNGFFTATGTATGGFSTKAICIGNTRYTFAPGTQIGSQSNQILHALWRDTNPTPGTCDLSGSNSVDLNSPNLDSNDPSGTELMGPRSRLVNFSIVSINSTGSGSPYQINIFMALGDGGLLCSSSAVPNSCSTDAAMPTTATVPSYVNYTKPDLTCKGHTGDQFCATGSLTTTATQRLR